MQTYDAGKLNLWMPATGVATVKSGGTWYPTGILSAFGNRTASLSSMQSLDISKGSITIGDGTVTQTGQSPTVNPNGYVIAQNGSNSTTNTVSVTGGTHNIVLRGVTIDVSNNANAYAFALSTGATVNLTLSGTNKLQSGQNRAGLEAPQGASLAITGGASDSLIASSYTFGAGIGGGGSLSGNSSAGGTITINDGKIDANGSAGIGGGYGPDTGGAGGTITINGGAVNTTRPDDGFWVIGGGYKGSAGTTTITGGSVKASSIQGTPTNGSVDIYPATVSVPSGKNVNTLAVKQSYTAYSYGYKDMQTDNTSYGKFYFWLPADTAPQETTADIVTDSGVYTGYHDQRGVSSSATVDNPGVLKMDHS